MPGKNVTLAAAVIAQGEKAVGSATVQLSTTPMRCSRIWFGAPTARHTKTAANTSIVLIGKTSAGNASGGIPLDPTNTAGFFYPCDDASLVYLTGFTAGDVAEYQVFA